MKKVLWIACLLLVMPFLGYAQKHAGLAEQDIRAFYGTAPVSNPLPNHVQMNIDRPRDGEDEIFGHVMYIPTSGQHYGYYYAIYKSGTIQTVCRYDGYYLTSAEYYKPWSETGEIDDVDAGFPVFAYSDDLTKGWHRVAYDKGTDCGTFSPAMNAIRELTYDYVHDAPGREGRMLGLEYGYISQVNMNWGGTGGGTVDTLYSYTEHDGLYPLAMACDLTGTLYFINLSTDGESSKLYYFASDDPNLENPIEVGELDWAAKFIQTMAFDHQDFDRLYWWQDREDGKTNLVEIIIEKDEDGMPTGCHTEMVADMGHTQMGGLIFEFLYKPYNVTCIDSTGGTIRLKDRGYTTMTDTYKPAKTVEFKVTNNSCYTIQTVYVLKAGKPFAPENIIYTIPASQLNAQGVGTFYMPACDVDIVGVWEGNPHNVHLTWKPNALVDALTIEGSSDDVTVNCGDEVEVTYDHPENYFLLGITVKQHKGAIWQNLPGGYTVDAANSTISFTMPDYDVQVEATYQKLKLDSIPPICQYQGMPHPIQNPHNLDQQTGGAHGHKWTFTDPNGVAHNYGPFTNDQSDAFLSSLTFDIVGTWHYTGEFTSPTWGNFPLETREFEVYAAPTGIAIQEEYVIDAELGLVYNAHYNCEGDSILLTVVATPSTYEWNGTFEWKKKNAAGEFEVVNTTTENYWLIKPCERLTHEGLYQVTYTPNTDATTDDEEPICQFELNEPFAVNIASIPNIPIINNNEDTIEVCHQSPATLEWKYGVLKPWEYDKQWYIVRDSILETGETIQVWDSIPGATDIVYETGNLEALPDGPAYYNFALSINYAKDAEHGEYYLCHRESKIVTVYVHEAAELEIEGDLETCKGINPENNPYVINDGYTTFEWWFNHELLAETSNELHFEALGNALVNEPGLFWVEVYGYGQSACPAYKKFQFEVKALPNLYMTNNQTEDTAWAGDSPIKEITVCAGTRVRLFANGGTNYTWGLGLEALEADFYTFTAEETTTKQFTGYDEETGCENTVYLKINVNPRPEVAWVLPTQDTTFSMITDEYQLVAEPAGGIFTYIIPSEPDVDYPIDDGILRPSELGIGTYQLIYVYTDANGCSSERRIRNITIEKPYWTDEDKWDPTWMYNCENNLPPHRFEITTPAQMGSFMAYVYGLNGVAKRDFEGDTIWIMNNIDLQQKPYFYRPFIRANDSAVFKGVIDGTGKIVSNMTILEDNLLMDVEGFIRNVGVKDAKVTSVGAPCQVDVLADAKLHNSYITMPELNNVVPKLMPFGDLPILPSGEVRNVYYYGIIPGIPNTIPGSTNPYAVYMESTETPQVQTTFDGINSVRLYNPATDKGILEEWVWLQNDYYYYTWQNEDNNVNYAYPYHKDVFMHHHYIHVNVCDEATLVGLTGDAKVRTLQYHPEIGKDTTYALNGETVTVTIEPNQYVKVDSLICTATGYNGVKDSVWSVKSSTNTFDVLMPVDSMPLPAYELTIETSCRRDYWTDEGNYNPTWYTNCINTLPANRFEIKSNRDLAAFAHAVMFEGKDFDGCIVVIDGSENATMGECGKQILDMAGHFWLPIEGFRGILDGKNYIVKNLYIREEISAMFVNTEGATLRNMGIQDIDLPKDEDAMIAAYIYNNGDNFTGSVINSFAVNDPATHVTYPLAVGNVTLTNCYKLDENGFEVNENGVGTDVGKLQAWVHAQTEPGIYFDWMPDECPINYNHPIHDGLYDGGWAITYDPSDDDNLDGSMGGSVHGPSTGKTGQLIQVMPKPNFPCNNCTRLWVTDNDGNPLTDDDGNDISDILNTEEFVMPNFPVIVHGAFAPINWTLTIDYIVDDEPALNPDSYVNENVNYNQEVVVPRPVLADYEPVDGKAYDTIIMPCAHKTVEVHYIGKQHTVSFCEDMPEVDTAYTNHDDNVFRYHETVNVTVTAKDSYSIPEDQITITGGGKTYTLAELNFTGSNGHYTFTMPNTDVTICFGFTEEFWDDYGIANIDWFIGNEDADEYTLEIDSMLGGLAALVSGREWLWQEGYYTEEEVAGFDFAGKTIKVVDKYGNGVIDLIEHKWRPIGAQLLYTKYFQGYFDGQNVEIINMTTHDFTLDGVDDDFDNAVINGSCQGFFGNVGEDAVVTNLHIQGVATGRYFTAGIAGVNYGLIMNSVANVKVRSEFEAGGIVANNFGTMVNNYCIADTIDCMSAMPLPNSKSTNNFYIGGVAAYNAGLISNCHSVAYLYRSGSMGTNPTNWYGGIVGMNEGMVESSFWLENDEYEALGGGTALDASCGVITPATAAAMNTKAQGLSAEMGLELNGWKQGDDGYPVFDLTAKMIMSNSENDINVDLYPNPTKGMVNIFSENIQRVTVYNMFGQMVLDTEVNANQTTINMSTFSAGVYMVRIATAEGVATRNVIVE